MPGHDEQRVVDPHAEPDERRERGRERGDVDHVREQAGEAQPAAEREHRGEERKQRRPERAERDRQHGRRGDEPDQLARTAARLLGRLLDAASGELDLQPVAARRLGGRDELVVGRLGNVGDRLRAVHVHVGERDRAVPRDLPRGRLRRERAVDALDVRDAGDPRERPLDPRVDPRIGDVPRGEDHLVRVGRLGLEVVGEEVQGRRRLGPGQGERVRVARARARVQAAHGDERGDPDGEDYELVGEARARKRSHRRDTIGGERGLALPMTSD
jgi:hypothetical protein